MSDETLRGMHAMPIPSTPEEMSAQGFTFRNDPLGGAAQALLEDKALGLREARDLASTAASLLNDSKALCSPELEEVAILMLKRAKALLGKEPK